jgi:hypothetical protein
VCSFFRNKSTDASRHIQRHIEVFLQLMGRCAMFKAIYALAGLWIGAAISNTSY